MGDRRWTLRGAVDNEGDSVGDWLVRSVSRLAPGEEVEVVEAVRLAHAEEERAVVTMEREWLLGAWAAALDIPQAQAEAEMLVASEKWRELAAARRALAGDEAS